LQPVRPPVVIPDQTPGSGQGGKVPQQEAEIAVVSQNAHKHPQLAQGNGTPVVSGAENGTRAERKDFWPNTCTQKDAVAS